MTVLSADLTDAFLKVHTNFPVFLSEDLLFFAKSDEVDLNPLLMALANIVDQMNQASERMLASQIPALVNSVYSLITNEHQTGFKALLACASNAKTAKHSLYLLSNLLALASQLSEENQKVTQKFLQEHPYSSELLKLKSTN